MTDIASFTVAPTQPRGLPPGFVLEDEGIWLEGDKDGARRLFVCSVVRVVAQCRSPSGEGWGRLVESIDPDGRTHRWFMPAELFAGEGLDVCREALSRGVTIGTSRGARPAFLRLLQEWRVAARAVTARRPGWLDAAARTFVLPCGRAIGEGEVVYVPGRAGAPMAGPWAAGTLADWRCEVAGPCLDNPLLILCVSLVLAGPLLEPLGLEGGGLHLRGQSSQGKSTAQRIAASVWGPPRVLTRSWRATANGLEGAALAGHGTVTILDEMGEIDGRIAGQAAYMLANGQGKARADRSGALARPATWRTAILSSGELALAEKMAEAGLRARAGQDVRLLDLPADGRAHGLFDALHGEADGAAFARRLDRAAAHRHGTVGPALVGAMIADIEGVLSRVRTYMVRFEAEARVIAGAGADGQVDQAARRLAVVAAAGEVGGTLGLTGWAAGEAQGAVLIAFRLWLDGRGGAGAAEAHGAMRRTRAFLVNHGDGRFVHFRGGDVGLRVAARAGWRDDDNFYVAVDVWRDEVHAGHDARRTARHLLAVGLLVPGDGRNLAVKLPHSVPGRPRAYQIPIAILGHGDD